MNKPAQIYRRGKPIQPASESGDSDSDAKSTHETQQQKLTINIQSDSLDKTAPNYPPDPSKPLEPSSSKSNAVNAPESECDSGSSSSGDEESSDEHDEDESEDDDEEEEEEEEKLVPIYKPVFISKNNRQTVPASNQNPSGPDDPDLEAQKKLEEENLRRKLSSQKLVEQTLMREIAEKEAGEVFPEVDDTDGLDPEAEFESWKLRELTRLKRDREAVLQRAKEKEELEARRALPESQRLKEDLEFAEQTRKAKPKTKQAFLQKYHHKGAFYNDAEILKKHDYNAPTEGTFTKMELLPSVMQVRDFGKMSRSKWTHLSKEDTTSFDAGWYQKSNGGKNSKSAPAGCFKCGQIGHLQKDCTKDVGGGASKNAGQGTNRVEIGTRRRREDEGEPRKRREDSGHDDLYPSKRREGSEHHRRHDRSPRPARDTDKNDQRTARESRRGDDDRYRHSDDRYRARDHRDHSHKSYRNESRCDDTRDSRRDRSRSPRRRHHRD